MALIYKKASKVYKAQLGISQFMLQAGGVQMPGLDMNMKSFNTGTTAGQNVAALNTEKKAYSKATDNSILSNSLLTGGFDPTSGGMGQGQADQDFIKKNSVSVEESNKKEAAQGGTVKGIGSTAMNAAKKSGGGGSPGIGMAASAASGIVAGFGDDGDDNYTGGEQAADIGASALKYGAMGASFGPWGAAAGAVVGTAIGVAGVMKTNKKNHNDAWKKDEKEEKEAADIKKTSIANRTANISAAADEMYGSRIGGNAAGGYGTAVVRKGGKFIFNNTADFVGKIDKNAYIGEVIFKRGGKIDKLKKGGKVKPTENIIPNGVLHEEENSLGDKGMPVVKCSMKDNSCTKHYEIEKDEMILTLSTTKKIEELAYGGKLDELGDFVKKQIMDNTHSYTKKFKFLNGDETIFVKDRR